MIRKYGIEAGYYRSAFDKFDEEDVEVIYGPLWTQNRQKICDTGISSDSMLCPYLSNRATLEPLSLKEIKHAVQMSISDNF